MRLDLWQPFMDRNRNLWDSKGGRNSLDKGLVVGDLSLEASEIRIWALSHLRVELHYET